MRPGVSIVIPTWNGLALLRRFLPSVLTAANRYARVYGARVEVLIVDDGSSDDSRQWLLDYGFADSSALTPRKQAGALPQVAESHLPTKPGELPITLKLVTSEVNRGFGETCNRGIAAASQPLVFLLNNDVEVDEDAIAPLVENFKDELVFAAHCRVFDLETGREVGVGKVGGFSRGFIRVHRSYKPTQSVNSEGPLYSMFAGGGSAMFDRLKFLELGGFEPLLSPFYWEDVELSYRAWKRGFTVRYEPGSVTRHQVSSTISKLNRGRVRRIEQRNRLMYDWIHLHDSKFLASHCVWVALLTVTAPFRLNPRFIASVFDALGRLPAILKRRREERAAAQRTDRQVFELFESLSRRSDVEVFDEPRDTR